MANHPEVWVLQRRLKKNQAAADAWDFVEEYDKPGPAEDRLRFKRKHGWDRNEADFRVVRREIKETPLEW